MTPSANSTGAVVVKSREDVEADIRDVESKLAEQYGLPRVGTRRELVRLVRASEIPETPLIARWLMLYSTLARWAREKPAPARCEPDSKKAAETRPSLFVRSSW